MKAAVDDADVVEQNAALRQAARQAFYTYRFTLSNLRAHANRQQLTAGRIYRGLETLVERRNHHMGTLDPDAERRNHALATLSFNLSFPLSCMSVL